MTDIHPFVRAFREAAPYIHYLRGKTLVVCLDSALSDEAALPLLAADLNLLAALGVRLVLVYGLQRQVEDLCRQNGIGLAYHRERRITTEAVLQQVKQASGSVAADIQAALSLGFAHAPQPVKRLPVVCGNVLWARPLGVWDGVDMQYSGQVRKTDAVAVNRYLDGGSIVLVAPVGISPIGQLYSLSAYEAAQEIAVAIKAEKLLFLIEENGICGQDGRVCNTLNAQQTEEILRSGSLNADTGQLLQAAVQALDGGVSRVQILSGRNNGDVLRELFTRHGAGTSLSRQAMTRIRTAQESDIPELAALLAPLEEQGILRRRDKAELERHIRRFFLLENDRQLYGCVALRTFADAPHIGELECLAVSREARDSGYGEQLLAHLLKEARRAGIQRLFALTTQTADWFAERGFQAASADELPFERQEIYRSNRRQSKVMVLDLSLQAA